VDENIPPALDRKNSETAATGDSAAMDAQGSIPTLIIMPLSLFFNAL